MRKLLIAALIAATAVPAMARPPAWAPAHGYRTHDRNIAYRTTDNGVRY